MKLSDDQLAVVQTLAYAAVFSFPLRLTEIQSYLIHSRPTTLAEIRTALRQLQKMKLVKSQNKKYFMVSTAWKNTQDRGELLQYVRGKQQLAARFIRSFGWIPTIRAVYITGGTAVGNVHKEDDLDLMIITSAGWLWATRLVVVLCSLTFGVYRTQHSKNVADLWCLNMWLDEASLAVPKHMRSLYTAHEVAQAKPILDKSGTHNAFLNANAWVLRILPNAFRPLSPVREKDFIRTPHMNLIEHIAYLIQKLKMRAAQSREIVMPNSAYFHPRNTDRLVMQQYRRILNRATS